jgi:hypothetical protein
VPPSGRKPIRPRDGEGKDVLVSLSPELTIKLLAFCDAHYGASQTRVFCEALGDFIDRRLESEPQMRLRYKAAHDKLTRPSAEIVRIDEPDTREDRSGHGQ